MLLYTLVQKSNRKTFNFSYFNPNNNFCTYHSPLVTDVYGQNIRLSGTRGGYPMYSPDPSADCEGLIVTRGGSRVEKMIKCDLCGKVYRTSNMARHKKRYCKAVIRNTGNGVEDSTNAILNNP